MTTKELRTTSLFLSPLLGGKLAFIKCRAILSWLGYFLVTLLIFCILIPASKKLFKLSLVQIWPMARLWAKGSLFSFGSKVIVINEHNIDLNKSYIVGGNHRSWMDHFVIMEALSFPLHIFGKSDFYEIPIFKWGATACETIKVKNKSLTMDEKEKVSKYLSRSESFIMFFEGTRGTGRQLLPFKPGAFSMATKSNISILPVYILGAEQRLSKTKSLLDLRPGNIHIVIDKPVIFQSENLEQQIKDFENQYTLKYQELYDRYEFV